MCPTPGQRHGGAATARCLPFQQPYLRAGVLCGNGTFWCAHHLHQVIDDTKGHTLVAASTLTPTIKGALTEGSGANKVQLLVCGECGVAVGVFSNASLCVAVGAFRGAFAVGAFSSASLCNVVVDVAASCCALLLVRFVARHCALLASVPAHRCALSVVGQFSGASLCVVGC